MTEMDFSIWMALIACVVGGVRIGLLLAQATEPSPEGETTAPPPRDLLDDRRLIGVALLAAHAGSAAVLGYGSALGHGMALALGLGWLGAAGTRFWNARKLGHKANGGVVDLLTGLALALPAWSDLARLARGSII
jgi:hypothetical protein